MQSKSRRLFNGKTGLIALLALSPILPIGLSGCPCACTQLPPFIPYIPLSVAIGDFNSDGAADIAVGTFRYYEDSPASDSAVSVVLQDRNFPGMFQRGIDVPLLQGVPSTLAAVNIDAASGVDLVVAGTAFNSDNVVTLLQTSTPPGPLSPPVTLTTGVGAAVDIAVGDLNGDTAQDLAIADRTGGKIVVLVQDSAVPGRFLAPTNLAVGRLITSVAIGDLNGDGRPDLAATSTEFDHTAGRLSLFLADAANGQFLSRFDIEIGGRPTDVAAKDLSGDGRIDLIVVDQFARQIAVLSQSSTQPGSFNAPATFATDHTPSTMAIDDLNGDGRLDVVTVNFFPNSVSVLLQSPAIAGALMPGANYPVPIVPGTVDIGLLNGDSNPDIAVAAGNRATVLFNSSAAPGTFNAPVQVGN